MKIETAHARVLREDETETEFEAKVPTHFDTKAAVDELIKTTRKLLKRHGIKDI